MYLMRLALRPWRMAPFSQIFSAIAVSTMLLFAGSMLWIEQSLDPIVDRLENEQVITAYLDPVISESDQSQAIDSIKSSMSGTRADIKTVDQPEFLEQISKVYPELSRELKEFGGDIKALVPRYVSIAGVLSDSSVETIRRIPGVERVEASKGRFVHVLNAFEALRWIARALAVGLLIALATGLIHLGRMNAHLHRDSRNLLGLWGADPLTLRAPVIASAMIVGLVGGFMALIGWIFASPWLATQVQAISPIFGSFLKPSIAMGWALLSVGALSGVGAGIVCSIAAEQE